VSTAKPDGTKASPHKVERGPATTLKTAIGRFRFFLELLDPLIIQIYLISN
jgi:hypothetical protein